MRYRLRTLLILLAVLPPILAPVFVWSWREYMAWRNTPPSRSIIPAGYLGAELDDTGSQGLGVQVMAVRPGSPAESAGLLRGDVISQVNYKRCRDLDDYDAAKGRLGPGSLLPLVVTRNGTQKSLTVKLGKRPASQPHPAIPVPTESSDEPIEMSQVSIAVSASELLESRQFRNQLPRPTSQ